MLCYDDWYEMFGATAEAEILEWWVNRPDWIIKDPDFNSGCSIEDYVDGMLEAEYEDYVAGVYDRAYDNYKDEMLGV